VLLYLTIIAPFQWTTPYQIIPNSAPLIIATGGGVPNHFDEMKDTAEMRTNHGSLSRGLPCCDSLLINPILQSRYTAVYTKPTAPHSTPLSAEFSSGFVRIFLQIGRHAVLMRIPGKNIAIYPRTAPSTGFPGLANAPRKTAKF
jgi:hypothetical protein